MTRGARHGLALIELLVALALLMAAGAAFSQMLGLRARMQRLVMDEQRLVLEANNLLEELGQVPWNQLEDRTVADLAEQANERLRDGALEVRLSQEDEARQIRVWLIKRRADDVRHRIGCLTMWRYPPALARDEEVLR